MAKTPFRERAIADYERPFATETIHVTASGVVTIEPILLYHVGVYQTVAGNAVYMRVRVHDASGTIRWFLTRTGIGNEEQSLEGVLFNNGIYADFTSSAGTYGASFEFVKLNDLPWYRRGMDVADVNEAFARARTTSRIFPLGVGPPGGGGGGGADPITPPTGGGTPPGGGL